VFRRESAYITANSISPGWNLRRINLAVFVLIIVVYIIGQFLIGTYHPDKKEFIFNAPADTDFLYYAAIANGVFNGFPPQNPAFYGEKLTQPFIQYYPLGVLSKFVNPYNGIRILNVVYLIIFGMLLKRFFPENFGAAIVVLFAGSSFGVQLNSLGIDLISRGFTHAPFFLLLTYAMFGKVPKLRSAAIFLCSFINGYMMLMIIPAIAVWFVLERKKELLYIGIAGVMGVILAGLFITSSASGKPFYFVFTESFRFGPLEILKHAIPAIIFVVLMRSMPATILTIVAIIFGSLFHYNPFFPIFTVYFAAAVAIMHGAPRFFNIQSFIYPALLLLFVGFLTEAWQKFDPDRRAYVPMTDESTNKAIQWAKENTDSDACFLALTADAADVALIMEDRPVYLGAIGHIAHLGLNWQPRYDSTNLAFMGKGIPGVVDYIFYGPVERKYFPHAAFGHPEVYRDDHVAIYKAK